VDLGDEDLRRSNREDRRFSFIHQGELPAPETERNRQWITDETTRTDFIADFPNTNFRKANGPSFNRWHIRNWFYRSQRRSIGLLICGVKLNTPFVFVCTVITAIEIKADDTSMALRFGDLRTKLRIPSKFNRSKDDFPDVSNG
jgi:hypothetical protein